MLSPHRFFHLLTTFLLLLISSKVFAFCNTDERFGAAAMAISGQHVFIANGNTNRAVTVCDMSDGGKVISNCTPTSSIIAGQADIKIVGQTAYISNMDLKSVTACDISNKDLKNCKVINDPSFDSPYGIHIVENSIYITNHDINEMEKVSVCRVNGKEISNCINTNQEFHDPFFIATIDNYAFLSNHDATISACEFDGADFKNCEIALRGIYPPPDSNIIISNEDQYYSILALDKYVYITNFNKPTVTVCERQGKTLSCTLSQPTPTSAFITDIKTIIINKNIAYFTNFKENSITACDVNGAVFSNCIENRLPNFHP